MADLEFVFQGKLWDYQGKGAWHFITLPAEISANIKMLTSRHGFGSVRCTAIIKDAKWKTSLFPDAKSRCYFLPVKAVVRKSCNIIAGTAITVRVEIDIGE